MPSDRQRWGTPMTTVIYADRTNDIASAAAGDGGDLWVGTDDLEAASGWHLGPQGVCAGDVCVVVPSGAVWEQASRFNLSALARHLGQPVAAAPDEGVWVF